MAISCSTLAFFPSLFLHKFRYCIVCSFSSRENLKLVISRVRKNFDLQVFDMYFEVMDTGNKLMFSAISFVRYTPCRNFSNFFL